MNSLIENNLKAASTYKIGGEYRVEDLSLRGGYRYEESPYTDDTSYGNLDGFSLGLGYKFGNYHFDVAYTRAEQKINQQLYNEGLTTPASINQTNSNLILTLGFQL